MELLDIYNVDKVKTGKVIQRGDSLLENEYINVVEIIVINSNNEILITQRHQKKPHALKWECPGGSVISGESSIEGAKRELFEETGIVAQNLVLINSEVKEHLIIDSYLYHFDFDSNSICLQEGETIDKNKILFEQLDNLYLEDKFINYQYQRIKNLIVYKL